jgi:ADP-ribose pyrophosphatase YjhB (NUDIX family)
MPARCLSCATDPSRGPRLRRDSAVHPNHVYKVYFHCEIIGGEPRANDESDESGFFAPDSLPELSVGRVLESQIRQFFARVQSGSEVVLFD